MNFLAQVQRWALCLFLCFLAIRSIAPLSAQSWIQQGLDIDGETDYDQSGWSVSLSSDGTTVAIGALFSDGNGSNAGHVRVYKRVSGVWTQQGADIDGEANDDNSGYAVSLSSDGTTVAIGALYNAAGGTYRGHVRVYKLVSGVWTKQGADIDGEANNDQSGSSVSLSSDGLTVAIGAPINAAGGINRGHVRVYKLVSGVWTQQGADIDGEANEDNSGYAVSLSSDGLTVAIGAPYNAAGGINRGHVRVYKLVSGVWTKQGADIDGEEDEDGLGWSVSLSSDGLTVAIGEPYNAGGGILKGRVRVYQLVSGTWTQQGADIDGEQNYSQSGWSVSLSSDGMTVAVGVPNNDGGGTNRGHVRVYKLVSGSWTQQGVDIEGEADDDESGISVSLSSDGTTVAIGAYLNNGGSTYRGHVRVYNFAIPTTSITCTLTSPPAYYCVGSTLTASYTVSGVTLNAGNAFALQLSDASGSFASPTTLGTLTSTATSGTISGMIPWAQAAGTAYRVRVVSSDSPFTGSDNGSNFEIKVSAATASISANGGILANPMASGQTNKLFTGCQGTNIVLTAVTSNAPSHKWFRNGAQVGNTDDPTLTVSSSWGDYELIAYDANSCGQATDTVGISLKPTPVANGGLDRNICQGTTTTIGATAQANTTYTWTPNDGHLSSFSAANPTVLATLPNTTTYNLQITRSYTVLDANFTCTSVADPVNITLKPQPASPTVLASATNVCQGTTITLTASNVVGSLRWFVDNVVGASNNPLNVTSTSGTAKTYTAKNLGANGCFSVPSTGLSVTIQNAPVPTITSSVGTDVGNIIRVCPGITNAILTANVTAGTPTYTWFNPPNLTSIGSNTTLALSNVATTNKSYYVRATYVYGALTCVKQSVNKTIRQDATAIGCRVMQNTTETFKNALSVYPNPTENLLTAKIQVAEAGEATLTLLNSLGQNIWSEKRSFEEGDTDIQLSLETLPAGIYILSFDKENVHQSVKVVKE